MNRCSWVIVLLWISSCGGAPIDPSDAGVGDGGTRDASVEDAAAEDASRMDGGADGGRTDGSLASDSSVDDAGIDAAAIGPETRCDDGLDDDADGAVDCDDLDCAAACAARCTLPAGAAGDVWAEIGRPSASHVVNDLAFAPDGSLYATVFREGIYRARAPCYSEWELVYAAETGWRSLAVSRGGTIVAGTGAAASDGTLPLTLVRSLDGGESWEDLIPILAALGGRAPISYYSMAASPDEGSIYVGSGWSRGETILYRSHDDGRTWSRGVASAERTVSTVAVGIVAEPGGRVVVGTEGEGAWVSHDRGASFPIASWILRPLPRRQVRTVRTHPSARVYASLDNGPDGEGGLYRENDEGSLVLLPPPPALGSIDGRWRATLPDFRFAPSGAIVVIASQNYAGGRHTIAVSRDMGATWSAFDAGIASDRLVQGLEPGPDGYLYGHGTEGAVYRTRAPLD